jgi:hypothetical protein
VDLQFSMNEYVSRIANGLAEIDKSRLPDFLILSPPRTGTTWLAQNLSWHPDLFIAPEKELRFFDVGWQYSDINYYVERLAGRSEKLKGDATPTYVLLPRKIIKLLHAAKPSMKFIVIVRDVAGRAWSNFNHSYAVGELGLHSGITFPGIVHDEKVINYLISDYSTSVGDYEEYLSRWLSYFPKEQFLIAGMNELHSGAADLLSRVYGFLGIATDVQRTDAHLNRINVGMRSMLQTDRISQLLYSLYQARQHQQNKFFHDVFDYEVEASCEDEERQAQLVELLNRADGYKLFIWKGQFYACNLEVFEHAKASIVESANIDVPHVKSKHYGDLLVQLEVKKRGGEKSYPAEQNEDVRLLNILRELVADYQASNALHINLATPRLIKEHQEFNLLTVGGATIALRQSLGPVDLADGELEKLVSRYGPDNVIIGDSVGEVARAIDSILLNANLRKKSAAEQHAVQQQLDNLQQLARAVNERASQTDRLLHDLLECFNTAQSISAAKQEAVQQQLTSLQQQAGAANERTSETGRLLHILLTRFDTALSESGANQQSTQKQLGSIQQQVEGVTNNPFVRFGDVIERFFKRKGSKQ